MELVNVHPKSTHDAYFNPGHFHHNQYISISLNVLIWTIHQYQRIQRRKQRQDEKKSETEQNRQKQAGTHRTL